MWLANAAAVWVLKLKRYWHADSTWFRYSVYHSLTNSHTHDIQEKDTLYLTLTKLID